MVRGVLDTHAAVLTCQEVLSVCGLAKAVVLDLRAVCELRADVDLLALLDEIRLHCRLTGCRLQVIADHPMCCGS